MWCLILLLLNITDLLGNTSVCNEYCNKKGTKHSSILHWNTCSSNKNTLPPLFFWAPTIWSSYSLTVVSYVLTEETVRPSGGPHNRVWIQHSYVGLLAHFNTKLNRDLWKNVMLLSTYVELNTSVLFWVHRSLFIKGMKTIFLMLQLSEITDWQYLNLTSFICRS